MYWPGTTAVASGTTGLEAESVPGVRGTGAGPAAAVPEQAVSPGAPRVMVPVAPVAGVPGTGPAVPRAGAALPCMADPDLFFAESPEDVESAKAMCRGCPARLACLAGALERQEPWGVWGGELFLRGEVVPRKRPRGRPRKTEVAA